jgi:dTDP-3-amino-3,4,6-trideoxy-alpha-D-glucose transaminase
MVLANDFRRQWDDLRADTLAAVEHVGASGWYVLGEEVRIFERELAKFWGAAHAVGVASGLDALEISLRILGCGPGDRVLTTPLSAFATTLAILKIGAVPVFVDTDDRGLIDLSRCRQLLERRSDIRYFVPVHLYGQALNGIELGRLRQDFDLRIVEDCAQSIGATSQGQPAGLAGQLAATSFYPTKNLGAMGDGGAILTSNAVFAEKAKSLRDYGQGEKYRHDHIGYNSRLDEVQAAILQRAALPRLDRWIQRRREAARAYLAGLRHPSVRLIKAEGGCWHLFPIFVEPEQRQSLLDHLKATGIGIGIHYPLAIPDQPALRNVEHELADACATARRVCASEVSLPIHPYLNDNEVEQVVAAVNSWRTAATSRA